jgi:hypothetical protein
VQIEDSPWRTFSLHLQVENLHYNLERNHHINPKRHLIIIAVERIVWRMIPADFRADLQVRAPLIVGEWLDGQADGGFVNVCGPRR